MGCDAQKQQQQQLNYYYYYPNCYSGYYCGHQCCYLEWLKAKQQQFEQSYLPHSQVTEDHTQAQQKNQQDKTQQTQTHPRKVDKSTNTNGMNGGTVSPASSASPPPAPPPLPISVRANYCARCRFNIAHSRHDLSSSTAQLPNGNLPTGNATTAYGIPQSAVYAGKLFPNYIYSFVIPWFLGETKTVFHNLTK